MYLLPRFFLTTSNNNLGLLLQIQCKRVLLPSLFESLISWLPIFVWFLVFLDRCGRRDCRVILCTRFGLI
jgi:hypothetical protein